MCAFYAPLAKVRKDEIYASLCRWLSRRGIISTDRVNYLYVLVRLVSESSRVSKGVDLIRPKGAVIGACQQAAWSRTKWSPTAYLEAAVAPLSFVLGKGCGQLRRLWSPSTGGSGVEKAAPGDAFAVMCFMNLPESIRQIHETRQTQRSLSLLDDGKKKINLQISSLVITFTYRPYRCIYWYHSSAKAINYK